MCRIQLVTLCWLLITGTTTDAAGAEDATDAEDVNPKEAESSETNTKTAKSEAGLTAGNHTEFSTDQMANSTTIPSVTQLIDLMTYKPSGEVENGGDPFVSPNGHKHGARHVRAHDGFHNIQNEPLWAHWNDVFSTTARSTT
ncbi:uncharacterized protein LOC117779793 isoform X2 [Drosophila innubila]|uniref:uncharacterized protein LOC117779793 isoform X2 n=1 Tax=Drosophila innubila TaxID=198719 RepID=UPI00148D9EFF|nr:uncharacterized protein LOC117779793 isoform X2 [Drosophila innubila]